MREVEITAFTSGVEVQPILGKDILLVHDQALSFLLNVTTEDGRMFASEDPRFHHEFARDLMLSAYFINQVKEYEPATELSQKLFLKLWRRTKGVVFNFWRNYQLENGQLLHEVKPYNPQDAENSFYHEFRSQLVNDDSVDATPLGLIVLPEFIETEKEYRIFEPLAKKAIGWMTHNMDTPGYNGWLCYKYNDKNHGHINQGWMDSRDSITYGTRTSSQDRPPDPIALVEVQGYAWKALSIWGDRLRTVDFRLSQELISRANDLKSRFNASFAMETDKGLYLAHGLDREGNQLRSVSINPGLALWASYKGESIIERQYVLWIVKRLLSPAMFDEEAGIRTFENGQGTYGDHEFYQTGDDQFWPIATSMWADALMKMGFREEGKTVMRAGLIPLKSFGSFIEHCRKRQNARRFFPLGRDNCQNQTWTGASALYGTALLIRSSGEALDN